jgi:hypothetical protein
MKPTNPVARICDGCNRRRIPSNGPDRHQRFLPIQGSDMKEQPFSLPVYLLGYPIALAMMITFYISEAVHRSFVMVQKLFAINPIAKRK